MKTLREFITEHELNPEDNGNGIDWYSPDEMIYQESRKIDGHTKLHIFSDGSLCGILDTDTTSILLSEDDLKDDYGF